MDGGMNDFPQVGSGGDARRNLSILMSAYACEPHLGSEPGVGWHWATRLASMGHQVRVLTRANNREVIESALAARPVPRLSFAYYDLPAWMRRWKNQAGLLARLYYLAWQWGAYGIARRLCRETRFDIVHHITFGVFRHPSFMAFLGLPFVFGPVGGGETAPRPLRKTFPLRGYLIDIARDLANWVVRVDPLMAAVFRRSAATLCKTAETLRCVPERFHDRCHVQVELGVDEQWPTLARGRSRVNGRMRVLYVGRLVYWKGLHLGLRAFARLHAVYPEARLTIVGRGPEAAWFHGLADGLGIGAAVTWIPHMERAGVMQAYLRHDAFLFPSLHDSSGNVVLEALSCGLPVVCLDAGGPAVLVDPSCGFKVRPGEPSQVVEDLARAMFALATQPGLAEAMGEAALRHAHEHYSWTRQVLRMEQLYRAICDGTRGPPGRAARAADRVSPP